ncbi:glycosyltransferase family 4 protein [Salinisphaera sp. SPP-AMP-43]|uniref:glycosyltransferase family 4 protein n=1 Tax=Salinisphaera sp. SPP-AMP-43 TaxID=3121288 RepID=UPI003C6E8B44
MLRENTNIDLIQILASITDPFIMPKKIAIYTTEFPPYPGGIATYVFQIANTLSKLGHDVEVCVFGGSVDKVPSQKGYFPVRVLSESGFSGSIDIFAMLARISWHLVRSTPDLAVAADFPTILALRNAPFRGHKIAVLHGTEIRNRMFSFLKKTKVMRPLMRFDRIIANSLFTRNLALEHHPYLQEERVVASYLGADGSWFEKSGFDVAADTGGLGKHQGRKLLLTVGRLEHRKGVINAIRAVASLPRDQRRRVTYIIAGKSVNEDYYQKLKSEIASAEADIRLAGAVGDSELRALYADAFCLIHPSVPTQLAVEGFGLVLLEAAAQGLPVISTYTDAIPEVVTDNLTGILVPPGDSQAMCDAIARMLNEEGLRSSLSQNGPAHAKKFSWESHVVSAFNGLL